MIKPLEFERVSIEEASQALDATRRPGSVQNWEGKRLPEAPAKLDEAAAAWLAALPASVRPKELARQFPRIANQLCLLWKRPSRCDAYFKQLVIDERGGRKGFPPEVAHEIATLRTHYATVYPYRHSIWDDTLGY